MIRSRAAMVRRGSEPRRRQHVARTTARRPAPWTSSRCLLAAAAWLCWCLLVCTAPYGAKALREEAELNVELEAASASGSGSFQRMNR